jgi:hypothetical protein
MVGYDLCCCKMGYDGERLLALPSALLALRERCNTLRLEERGPLSRACIYARRGFAFILPEW